MEYARTVRKLVGDIPLAVTGGFRTRDAIQRAVQAGECDVVGIGRPTITTPDAARLILEGQAEALTAHQARYGMRTLLGEITDLRVLDGVLDISWHTDQIHRLGNGLHPDLNRGSLAATIAMVRRNGRTSFPAKRGGS